MASSAYLFRLSATLRVEFTRTVAVDGTETTTAAFKNNAGTTLATLDLLTIDRLHSARMAFDQFVNTGGLESVTIT